MGSFCSPVSLFCTILLTTGNVKNFGWCLVTLSEIFGLLVSNTYIGVTIKLHKCFAKVVSLNLNWLDFKQTISVFSLGEKKCTKQRNRRGKSPQIVLIWKMNVFLLKLPHYFKIRCTILEILYKKMFTIISKCKNRYQGVTGVTTKFHKWIAELNYELNNSNKRCEWH